jgi:hypothetical protein
LLAVLAVAVAVTSFVLPRKLFTAGLAQVQIAVAEEPGEVVGSFRESAPVKRVVTNPEQAVLGALAKLQAPFIVGMALCESIALFGLMLGFIGESMRLAVVFFLVALALMALRYPRLATVTQAVERSSNAKCTL